jgi:sigma-B regulation protein RsbU (phosphoserine phosphatase)
VTEIPGVQRYQRLLNEFRQERVERGVLLKRMSELLALLDLTTSLGAELSGQAILDAVLLTAMGELGATRGGLWVRSQGGSDMLRASRGLGPDAASVTAIDAPARQSGGRPCSAASFPSLEALGLEVVCPVSRASRRLAVLGLGERADGRSYTPEDLAFLESVGACAATPIENGLIRDELRQVNQRLSVKVFQLHSLFDISRELTSSFDEEAVKSLTVTTLMGHLMVSHAALYLRESFGLTLAHERGGQGGEAAGVIPSQEGDALLDALTAPMPVDRLPPGEVRDEIERRGLAHVVPLRVGSVRRGFVALGPKVTGGAYTEEDFDLIYTLGRQALAALENVRLQRVRLEKQRQDRDLQIAREIQKSLFPPSCPEVPGFDIAGRTRPCHEVGGDYYDWIPLSNGAWALVIADVSGKGTPASILMASMHASLRALAGTASPEAIVARVNQFLFESTQASRYATLFYGELEPSLRRLRYVNAGHVPPFVIDSGGELGRLDVGGPAVGLLDGGTAQYESAEIVLDAGSVLALVTDGATEAMTPDDREFGDDGVALLLRRERSRTAAETIAQLFREIGEWAGERGQYDDLTALVLRAL